MADADSKLKDLSISETKKKKDGNPTKAPKKPQQPKKKIEGKELIGIDVAKEADLGEWYQQVITKGQMISYYDVAGCYILEPSSYAIWENIKAWFDNQIKTLKVRNAYFPIFISADNLEREKEHVEGFAAEVAWVTQGGKSKLDKPVAVRPTSETAMYPYFARKIQSHRDLPLKLNQWNNVVRWEFKHPMPFIRSREFLWQEGHTAHLTKEEAGAEVRQILDWYSDIYQELLATPVIKGQKTENEKFPGADYTTTIEGFIPATGRGIQAATSHCLGQHFSKMFNITVEDPNAKETGKSEKIHVWQNSWGLTTRSIGVMILTHGDNRGLVIPPRVAEIQVIVIPVGVTAKTTPEAKEDLYKKVQSITDDLRSVGVRAETDYREGYSPGWKFNDWELKGIPLRIEFGPKDAEKGQVTTSRRDVANKDEARGEIKVDDLKDAVPKLLEQIQTDMFNRADAEFRNHRKQLTNWDDFVPTLNGKNVVLVPHCEGEKCEDEIKDKSARKALGDDVAEDSKAPAMGAKSLCIPFDQPEGIVKGETKCINPDCKDFAKSWILFGRSY
ncbi:prolyl-tRNA synthetase [Aaosphaeria arxii CBS 175.79]|uniref:proline--tRNA ligase n=1 Tax=Aaosphaeria arxii CBS 175.79 TaxID=1450172 RepID=A0A6A5Y448_9PLEO|nr:prolyl-tRNA synthetase [Aaosphaeria arxii CBS 175.79]KAF2020049.1 prolyl-tRNA synthetase [Aaosphaeria arxii CBS 175.79]